MVDAGVPRFLPESVTDLQEQFDDDLAFFVLAARQALKAAWVLEQRGEAMPPFRQQQELRAWREYVEHWDAPARGAPDRAGNKWRSLSSEHEPGLSHSSMGNELTEVSGVRVDWLAEDLRAARRSAGVVSEREWAYCYIDENEAAMILGISVQEFLSISPRPPGRFDFGTDNGYPGVRYFRDWVEARRDGLLYPPGWEDWVEPR
ncbi:hypothetical protein GCM10011519_33630 [Marmoricola endophyticus]|uniref:Uncharacterized protein n=1 Tax=Marmoricola endophyticus TaxID=2040280 RepID=A0A917F830_9ACTN|nr:hypothetical protein GCM10011519_33630 [Marmoricola endophyticus]